MRLAIGRVLLPTLAAILLSADPAAAQQDTVPAASRRGGVAMIGGLRVGWPQKLSAYAGVGLPEKRYSGGYTGLALTAEAGLGAGAVRAGWTTAGGIGMLARAQLGVMRTWGDPWLVGPGQTWVGGDAQAGFGFVGLAVGAWVRAPAGEFDPAPMLTFNLYFGN